MKQNQQHDTEVAKLIYEPPSLTCLGSLEELTLAKGSGLSDSLGDST